MVNVKKARGSGVIVWHHIMTFSAPVLVWNIRRSGLGPSAYGFIYYLAAIAAVTPYNDVKVFAIYHLPFGHPFRF